MSKGWSTCRFSLYFSRPSNFLSKACDSHCHAFHCALTELWTAHCSLKRRAQRFPRWWACSCWSLCWAASVFHGRSRWPVAARSYFAGSAALPRTSCCVQRSIQSEAFDPTGWSSRSPPRPLRCRTSARAIRSVAPLKRNRKSDRAKWISFDCTHFRNTARSQGQSWKFVGTFHRSTQAKTPCCQSGPLPVLIIWSPQKRQFRRAVFRTALPLSCSTAGSQS